MSPKRSGARLPPPPFSATRRSLERDRTIAAFKRARDQGARLDGVLTTGFNARASTSSQCRPTKSAGLYADGRPRHRLAPRRTACARLRRQRRAARADRRGEAEASGQRRRRGAGQGMPRLPEHPGDRGPALPDCGHAFPPPKVQVDREASTLAILTTGKPQWLQVDGLLPCP